MHHIDDQFSALAAGRIGGVTTEAQAKIDSGAVSICVERVQGLRSQVQGLRMRMMELGNKVLGAQVLGATNASVSTPKPVPDGDLPKLQASLDDLDNAVHALEIQLDRFDRL